MWLPSPSTHKGKLAAPQGLSAPPALPYHLRARCRPLWSASSPRGSWAASWEGLLAKKASSSSFDILIALQEEGRAWRRLHAAAAATRTVAGIVCDPHIDSLFEVAYGLQGVVPLGQGLAEEVLAGVHRGGRAAVPLSN